MKAKKELNRQMLDLFGGQTKFCPYCRNLRTKVTVNELPKEATELKHLITTGLTLLYCQHCKTYSV